MRAAVSTTKQSEANALGRDGWSRSSNDLPP